MRKWPVLFAGFCRKALCKGKIKNYIFSAHNKIVQTDLMLSGPSGSGSSFKFADFKIRAENMAELLSLLYKKKINSSAGQQILKEMFSGADDDPSRIAERLDLAQIDDDSTLEDIVVKVIMSNSKQVEEYKAGKETVLKFLVGQVMKESKGKANPQKVEKILKNKLPACRPGRK